MNQTTPVTLPWTEKPKRGFDFYAFNFIILFFFSYGVYFLARRFLGIQLWFDPNPGDHPFLAATAAFAFAAFFACGAYGHMGGLGNITTIDHTGITGGKTGWPLPFTNKRLRLRPNAHLPVENIAAYYYFDTGGGPIDMPTMSYHGYKIRPSCKFVLNETRYALMIRENSDAERAWWIFHIVNTNNFQSAFDQMLDNHPTPQILIGDKTIHHKVRPQTNFTPTRQQETPDPNTP